MSARGGSLHGRVALSARAGRSHAVRLALRADMRAGHPARQYPAA